MHVRESHTSDIRDVLDNIKFVPQNITRGHVDEVPAACHETMLSDCSMIVQNTNQQNLIKAVHIFPTRIVVETQPAAPTIAAHRKGTEWIPYNGP